MDAFYATVSGMCFMLMGLWWGVANDRKEEWLKSNQTRKLAYGVYLSFLIPGVMALAAQLTGELKILWRIFFVIAGGIGLIVTIWFVQKTAPTKSKDHFRGWFIRRGRWVTALLYLLVIILGISPELAQLIDPKITGLQVEGILVTLLVFLGVSYAWEFMMDSKPTPPETTSAPPKSE